MKTNFPYVQVSEASRQEARVSPTAQDTPSPAEQRRKLVEEKKKLDALLSNYSHIELLKKKTEIFSKFDPDVAQREFKKVRRDFTSLRSQLVRKAQVIELALIKIRKRAGEEMFEKNNQLFHERLDAALRNCPTLVELQREVRRLNEQVELLIDALRTSSR